MFRKSAELHKKQTGKALSVQTNRRSRGLSSEMNMKGEGFKDLLKIGKRFKDRYGDMAKAVGADKVAKTTGKNIIKKKIPTFESRLKKAGVSEKVLKPIVKEVNKQLGEGAKEDIEWLNSVFKPIVKEGKIGKGMEGGSFWDTLVDIVSVLPIPLVSDAARTIKMVKTAVSTAKGEEPVKAFGGVISDVVDAVDTVMPGPLKEFTTTPAKQYSELYGYGNVSSDDRTKIVKVGLKHLDDTLGLIKLQNLPKRKAQQIMTAQRKIKQALPQINKIKVGGDSTDFLNEMIEQSSKGGLWYIGPHPKIPPTYDIISKNDIKRFKPLKGGNRKENFRNAIEYKKCRNKGFLYYDTRQKKCFNKSSDLFKK